MKQVLFNGGLNRRVAPHLIDPTQGVIHNNLDITKGHFVPRKDKIDVTADLALSGVLDYGFYFETANEGYFTSTINDWVVYADTLYKADRVGIPQKRVATNVFRNLGIAGPTVAPVVTPSGTPSTDTIQYAITYYNSADDSESQPVYTAEVLRGSTATAITSIPVSADPQVTHKRIYRIGGPVTKFTLAAAITNATTSYSDTIADDALQANLLRSETWSQAPAGLKYLVEAYAMLFGALGTKLRFTPIGLPNAWPETYYLQMPNTITGIAVTPVGLLVFTMTQTILVTGSGPLVLSQQVLDKSVGCVNHSTIANVKGAVVWISRDGLESSTGGSIVNVSKDKLGKLELTTEDFTNAVAYDEAYILQLHDGTTFVWDFGYGSIPCTWDYQVVSLAAARNALYGFANGKAYQLSLGEGNTVATFKSGWITSGDLSVEKVHNTVKIAFNGSVELTVWVNGVLAKQYNYSASEPTVSISKLPANFTRNNYFEFQLEGTGEVYELEILEYSANA